ncbi:MAG: hypothetical protein J5J00_02455 [Deltaproteobacteria bacterium]|nr:hypothetical protein [Deltaproteobacteria bacterium]
MVKVIRGFNTSLKKKYLSCCQAIGAGMNAPKRTTVQLGLFALGFGLLVGGLMQESLAAAGGRVTYNDQRIVESANAVLTYLEGSFGALVMVASGIGAILSAAFGQYRAALGLMVVAIGSFILRSLMSTFFNDTGIKK